jgi:hypothetical protein
VPHRVTELDGDSVQLFSVQQLTVQPPVLPIHCLGLRMGELRARMNMRLKESDLVKASKSGEH